MKILIIEDNDIKYSLVSEFLKESHPASSIRRAASYQSGIETLVTAVFDIVILDMTLPVSDIDHSLVGMNVFPFGGQLILREITRKRIKAKFIVLTQYDTFIREDEEVPFVQLRMELMQKYPDVVIGCVQLDSSSVNWKSELSTLIHNENPDR